MTVGVFKRCYHVLLFSFILVCTSCVRSCVEAGHVGASESEFCDHGDHTDCDDANSCTFDWCDAGTGLCHHDVTICPGCNSYKSTTSVGKHVDYIIILDETCAVNDTKAKVLSGLVASLLHVTQTAGMPYRVAIVNMAHALPGSGDNEAASAVDVALPFTCVYKQVANHLNSLRSDGTDAGLQSDYLADNLSASNVAMELFSLSRVLSIVSPSSSERKEDDEAAGGSRDKLGEKLRLCPHSDVHIVLLTGLCQHGNDLSPPQEDDITTWLDKVIGMATGFTGRLSMSVLLDGGDKSRVDNFGDPRLSSSFRDTSSFSRAVTLQSLINHGSVQASSLQAYLLSAAVEMRVFDINTLFSDGGNGAADDCVGMCANVARYMYRSLFEPAATLSLSRCALSTCVKGSGCHCSEQSCLGDDFCSPLVGCTNGNMTPVKDHPLILHSPSYKGHITVQESLLGNADRDKPARDLNDLSPLIEESKPNPQEGVATYTKTCSADSSSTSQCDGSKETDQLAAKYWKTEEDQKQSQQLPNVEDAAGNTASCVSDVPWRNALAPRPVNVMQISPTHSFVKELIAGEKPVILRNTMAAQWPALTKWTEEFLLRALNDTLLNVKRTRQAVTFDPDIKAPMATLNSLNLTTPYSVLNMSREEFFNSLEDSDFGHYYFTDLPVNLRKDLKDARLMFASVEDYKLRRHFLWLSSAGMVTHSHFDQDFNFFVQLSGHKTFTLWLPEDHTMMYAYPRLHPMWHKSQVDPAAVDTDLYPLFKHARPYVACLSPGDMLYIPPYVWHHVVSETRSISVSTYSHDNLVRRHMNAIYKHDHKFDLLAKTRGKMFVLRMFLDIMIHNLYGKGETRVFFNRLLNTRYSGLEKLFPIRDHHPRLCRSHKGVGHMPTAQHIYGYASFDAKIVTKHFMALPSVVRDILFLDYVEEISSQVVGVEDVYAFFRYCFHSDVEYYVTSLEDPEHDLWEHAVESDSNPEDMP